MAALYIVVPLALLLVGVAVGAFWWATRSGQLDDLVTPALRVITDDEDEAKGPKAEGS